MGWRAVVPSAAASDVSGADVLRGPQQGPAPGIAYAGFWIRVLAALIDTIIVGVPLVGRFSRGRGSAISASSPASTTQSTQGWRPASVRPRPHVDRIFRADRPRCRVALLRHPLVSARWNARPANARTSRRRRGNRKEHRDRASPGSLYGYVISSIPFDIGLIWAAFDPRKQGWHDKIASTFVVRKA